MAQQWAAKAPGEVVTREWAVPVPDGDGVASYTASISGATLDSDERNGDTVILTISAGLNGATAIATLTAETNEGVFLEQTFYLPIQATTNAHSYTVRDVCDFALRKVVGNGNSADSAELDDATERLSDMLAEWARCGADTGIPLPLAAGDTLYAPDGFISAIKHNLRVVCHEHYGQPIDATDMMAARRGLQIIKTANLPADRVGGCYF